MKSAILVSLCVFFFLSACESDSSSDKEDQACSELPCNPDPDTPPPEECPGDIDCNRPELNLTCIPDPDLSEIDWVAGLLRNKGITEIHVDSLAIALYDLYHCDQSPEESG
ncbi:MAG: hypothetical protein HRU19_03730 [Pseudobacteriovorax sp.]|nr:hypothetical protein [Pseudobacteriovorax sp.]